MTERKTDPVSDAGGPEVRMRDAFETPLPPGRVVGSHTTRGQRRSGADRESTLSVDGGALRIAPLIDAGWGRSCLAYPAHAATPGLMFAVSVLDGHNTSQAEPLSERFGRRLIRWLRGPYEKPDLATRLQRLRRFMDPAKAPRLTRQMLWWLRTDERTRSVRVLDENLAVGLHPFDVVNDPRLGAHFVMRALGPDNGGLCVNLGAETPTQVVAGVQNLPLLLVVALREGSCVYYAGSLTGARGLGPGWPWLRPLGIGPLPASPTLHPVLAQAVLGQIGFRADTRVFGAEVAHDPRFRPWWGGALWADSCAETTARRTETLAPPALFSEAPLGFVRGPEGLAVKTQEAASAWRSACDRAPGLVSFMLRTDADAQGAVGVSFRGVHASSFALICEPRRWRLQQSVPGGGAVTRLEGTRPPAGGDRWSRLQMLDDGRRITLVENATVLGTLEDDAQAEAAALSLEAHPHTHGFVVAGFEVHARALRLETATHLPWPVTVATTGERGPLHVRDALEGHGPLERHRTLEGLRWRRTLGQGRIHLEGGAGARVDASPTRPSPDRTIYAVPWRVPGADLAVEILAPGSGRDEGEKTRGGFAFWQDHRNYLTVSVYLDDHYGGASVSSFLHLDGYEDLYDAIWTNVGSRITWGRPFKFRVAFDGQTYQAFVNDEPVLFRRLSDVYPEQSALRLTRVGLVANWEWGRDTGTRFRHFEGRELVAGAHPPSVASS